MRYAVVIEKGERNYSATSRICPAAGALENAAHDELTVLPFRKMLQARNSNANSEWTASAAIDFLSQDGVGSSLLASS